MQFPDFKTEQWMNLYEKRAVHNLTDTTIQALPFSSLYQLEPEVFDSLILDYGDIPGSPRLRNEILKLYRNQDPKTLSIANGCLEANFVVMETLLEPGDHVIALFPGYQQFEQVPKSLGCSVSLVERNLSDWSLDPEKLRQAFKSETKMLILNNPANPTGAFFDEAQLNEIVSICRERDVWILCDEAFALPGEEMVSLSDLYEKGISTSSLSKTMGLAGIRLGWIKGPASLVDAIAVRNDYTLISAGPLRDACTWTALKHKEKFLRRAKEILDQNREIFEEWLKKQTSFHCILPKAGTTCFMKIDGIEADDQRFCVELLDETGIFLVPGSCFDMPGYVRIGLGQHHENLPQVLDQLAAWHQSWLEKELAKHQAQ